MRLAVAAAPATAPEAGVLGGCPYALIVSTRPSKSPEVRVRMAIPCFVVLDVSTFSMSLVVIVKSPL